MTVVWGSGPGGEPQREERAILRTPATCFPTVGVSEDSHSPSAAGSYVAVEDPGWGFSKMRNWLVRGHGSPFLGSLRPGPPRRHQHESRFSQASPRALPPPQEWCSAAADSPCVPPDQHGPLASSLSRQGHDRGTQTGRAGHRQQDGPSGLPSPPSPHSSASSSSTQPDAQGVLMVDS